MSSSVKRAASGPFVASQVRPGDPYELSHGHPIFCAPTGGSGAGPNGLGFTVLATDPAVEQAGVDVGYTPEEGTLRAPDVAVGNVPAQPGWVRGVPPLAVEYADVGQDEEALQQKIADLMAGGTRYLWIVRLVGPRRVEVHEPGQTVRVATAGQVLVAHGVLRNPVPVEALYDQREAFDVTLRNLLQRRGYESIEAVREEGREQGREQGRALALVTVLDARGLSISDAQRARILACSDAAILDTWLVRATHATRVEDVLGDE